MGDMSTQEHIKVLEDWMRSYRPEELFDENGTFVSELAALAPQGERRMGANPHANGGVLLRDLRMPDFRDYAVAVPKPGTVHGGGDAHRGRSLARCHEGERGKPELPGGQSGRE
jgi:xylulose-5-phosphate/fructose-6-phosphate phosphoketolase